MSAIRADVRQTFLNGAAQSKNFRNSRMIRLGEMPETAVSIMPNPAAADRRAIIGGVGELGVPTPVPAARVLARTWRALLSGVEPA